MEWIWNLRLNPSTVTLTLSLHGWSIGSAHWLTEVNILSKFNENLSNGKGYLKLKQNSSPDKLTFQLGIYPTRFLPIAEKA